MTGSKTLSSLAFVAAFSLIVAAPAHAQHRGGGGRVSGGVVHSGGVVRGGGHFGGGVVVAPRIISPRIVGYGAYRPYYYYRPGISIGFYAGFGYPYYYPYAYPYPYYYPYPSYSYPYPAYSYPPNYGYSQPGYSQPGYSQPGYAPQQPQTSVGVQPPQQQQRADVYGGVRIEGASRDAQVYVDGYYAGIVEDFDGANKHLNLTSGVHQVEIRMNGQQPVAFDVSVPPNQTVTVRVP